MNEGSCVIHGQHRTAGSIADEIERLQGEVARLRGESGARLSLLKEIRRTAQFGVPTVRVIGAELWQELCSATKDTRGTCPGVATAWPELTKNTPQWIGVDYGKDESVTAYRCTYCKQVFVNEPPEHHECLSEKDTDQCQ